MAKKKPFVLRIRPSGPHAWTWELCQRLPDTPRLEPLANSELTYFSSRWKMEQAEQDAAKALATFFDSDQVELETFTGGPRDIEYYQKTTNTGEVREMNQRNELAVQQQRKMANVRDLMERSKGQIAAAMPIAFPPERMMRIVATAIQKTPKLLECDPLSLIAAVMECAQLGLEPNSKLGHAHLVPFWNKKTQQNEVQTITGFTGLIELAVRSGKVSTIKAAVVYKKDHFRYEEGLEPRLEHVPSEEPDKGQMKAAYAVAKMTNGQSTFALMWVADINKIRDASPAGKSGPWVTHYPEMAKKTVIRRLCKTLPVSAVQQAISLNETADRGMSQGLAKLLDFDAMPALDTEPVTEEPETPPAQPPKKTPRKKAPPKKPTETALPETDQSEPDPSSVQMDEYLGMVTAADSLGDVDGVVDLVRADIVLTDEHENEVIAACEARHAAIKGSRGERSNG